MHPGLEKDRPPSPQAKTAHIENHLLGAQGKLDFTSTVPGTRQVGDITPTFPAAPMAVTPN
ncbi:hypothetical protein ACX80S_18435 [Arthrobacter sp. RHLT1-20]